MNNVLNKHEIIYTLMFVLYTIIELILRLVFRGSMTLNYDILTILGYIVVGLIIFGMFTRKNNKYFTIMLVIEILLVLHKVTV